MNIKKEISLMAKHKGRGYNIILMEINMKGNFKVINVQEKEYTNILMVRFMKEIFMVVRVKVKEFIRTLMVITMKEIG